MLGLKADAIPKTPVPIAVMRNNFCSKEQRIRQKSQFSNTSFQHHLSTKTIRQHPKRKGTKNNSSKHNTRDRIRLGFGQEPVSLKSNVKRDKVPIQQRPDLQFSDQVAHQAKLDRIAQPIQATRTEHQGRGAIPSNQIDVGRDVHDESS
jgi:hypothetical protein